MHESESAPVSSAEPVEPDLSHLRPINGALDFVGTKENLELENDTLVVREGESLRGIAARKEQEALELERNRDPKAKLA